MIFWTIRKKWLNPPFQNHVLSFVDKSRLLIDDLFLTSQKRQEESRPSSLCINVYVSNIFYSANTSIKEKEKCILYASLPLWITTRPLIKWAQLHSLLLLKSPSNLSSFLWVLFSVFFHMRPKEVAYLSFKVMNSWMILVTI